METDRRNRQCVFTFVFVDDITAREDDPKYIVTTAVCAVFVHTLHTQMLGLNAGKWCQSVSLLHHTWAISHVDRGAACL